MNVNKGRDLNNDSPFDDDIEGLFDGIQNNTTPKTNRVYSSDAVNDSLKNDEELNYYYHLSEENRKKKQAYDSILNDFESEYGIKLDAPEVYNSNLNFEEEFNKAETIEAKHEESVREKSIKNFHDEMNKNLSNPVNSHEEDFHSLTEKFDLLDNDQFKKIFSSFEKEGKDLNVYLKTGSFIKMNESKLSLMQSDKRVERLPDVKSEVSALILLSHEKGLKNFKINGNPEYVEEAMRQISHLNKKLGDNGFEVSCDPQFKPIYDKYFHKEEVVKPLKDDIKSDEKVSFTSDEVVKDRKAKP